MLYCYDSSSSSIFSSLFTHTGSYCITVRTSEKHRDDPVDDLVKGSFTMGFQETFTGSVTPMISVLVVLPDLPRSRSTGGRGGGAVARLLGRCGSPQWRSGGGGDVGGQVCW